MTGTLMAGALAAEEPWWEPGSTHGYHVNTLGFLAGEIVRRVGGASIGAFFRSEVGDPLDADFHFGFGAEEDHRVAEFTFGSAFGSESTDQRSEPAGEERKFLLNRVYLNPPGLSGIGTVNTRAWRAAEIPSANGHATARAVARIYGALGRGLLTPRDRRGGERRAVGRHGLRPGPAVPFRARLPAHPTRTAPGSQPTQLRSLRRRRLTRVRGSRHRDRVRATR